MENTINANAIENSSVIDGFSPEEIYVLCGALGVDTLFGLEEKNIVNINSKGNEEQWVKGLKKKEVLNEEGRLTKRGALLIRAIEIYSKSEEYAKLNNLYIALSKNGKKDSKEDNVVILFEDEKDVSYRIELWPRKRIISLLMDMYDFFRRRAVDEDYKYLINEIKGDDLEKVKKMELIGRYIINFEWFKRPADEDKKIGYEHKLFFSDESRIIQMDIVEQSYSYISLFYLYKQIFDWLNIPYGTGVLIDGQSTNKL